MTDLAETRPVTVVKLGGALLDRPEALAAVWASVAELRTPSLSTSSPFPPGEGQSEGHSTGDLAADVVVVHGGGPQATALARRLGHEPRVVAGRRVTTDLDLDVALWTLRGSLNARLVASARAAGVPAVGVSGVDGGLVRVERRPPREVDGATVDFGHVGDVVGSDASVLQALLGAGFVPTVAPVCADAAGALYNVNADTVAVEVAVALDAAALVFVAEAGGVRRDVADAGSRIARLDAAAVAAGVAAGWIDGGMRPKLETALDARRRGVPSVRIAAPGALADLSAGTHIVS